MKILITGVAGLIGSNFSEHLLKTIDGIEIVGIDNLSGGYQSNIHKNIKIYKNDLLEFDEIENIFKKHTFDYIYHFAAYAAEGLSPFIRKFNFVLRITKIFLYRFPVYIFRSPIISLP